MSRVTHFEIQATNPPALIAFYSALFQWKFRQWGTADYWVIETGTKDQPGINGGLRPRRGPPPIATQGLQSFVCTVEVESVDATLTAAAAQGGTIAMEKKPIRRIGWLAYIRDPDGNVFAINQPDIHAM